MKKWILGVLILVLLGGAYYAYTIYKAGFLPNIQVTDDDSVLLVYPEMNLKAVADTLDSKGLLKNKQALLSWADKKGVDDNIKPGRYQLKNGMLTNTLLNTLVSGNQTPLNVTLHNIDNVYSLAGKLAGYLEPDSISFLQFFQNETAISAYNLTPQTVTSVFIPNTYEFYWTSSPGKVLDRMLREYNAFWTEDRLMKASDESLTPLEVITLASIVEKETVQADEKPIVARLYLNRLKQRIKLQSDPTVIYAINLDYPKRRITRVYFKDLEYESPYNTYQNFGLPPGPIKIPQKSSIEAVLNAPIHKYIFMVADPKRPGYHSFATSLRQHNINRRIYINSLD